MKAKELERLEQAYRDALVREQEALARLEAARDTPGPATDRLLRVWEHAARRTQAARAAFLGTHRAGLTDSAA